MAKLATEALTEAVARLQTELNRADRVTAQELDVGTAEDLQVLRLLLSDGPTRVGALAKERGATVASASARLDRLERRGFLTRERLAGDRRAVVAVLSAAGERAAKSSRQRRLRALDAIATQFPTDELARLVVVLETSHA